MDKTLISKSIQQANRILEDYPMISEDIRKNGGILFEPVSNVNYKAATALDNSYIRFSDRAFSNYAKYIKVLAGEINSKMKMRVPNKYYDLYTITHEMGHVIEGYLIDGRKITKVEYNRRAAIVRNDIIKIAQQMTGKTKNELLSEMSGYGNRKAAEFFA